MQGQGYQPAGCAAAVAAGEVRIRAAFLGFALHDAKPSNLIFVEHDSPRAVQVFIVSITDLANHPVSTY